MARCDWAISRPCRPIPQCQSKHGGKQEGKVVPTYSIHIDFVAFLLNSKPNPYRHPNCFFFLHFFLLQPAEHGELCCEPGTRPAVDGSWPGQTWAGSRPGQTQHELIWPWKAEDKLIRAADAQEKLKLWAGEVPEKLSRPGEAGQQTERLAKWALQVEKRAWAEWFEVGWELATKVNFWSDWCLPLWSKQQL